MANLLNWFEIPTIDLERAARFYEAVLGVSLKREDFGGTPMAMFPSVKGSNGGTLVHDAHRRPSPDGALIYLNANGELEACLQRVAKAGGAVIAPKTDIGDPGYIGVFRDTEGNTVALHQER